MTEFVTICEVGPRDGLQMAKTIMATPTKIAWIEALAAAGLREIEVGSFVPAKLLPQMADTDAIVRAAVAIPNLTVVALAPNLRGTQAAIAAGAHRVSIPVSVSEGHSRANLNRSPDEQVAEIARIVAWLRSENHPAELEVACSTAFGCSFDGVIPEAQVLRVVTALAQAGVTSIGLADTVGYANPGAIKSLVRAVRAEIGPVLHGLHLHDTMGLGLANALAGLEAGIRDFDSALAGLGGCPFAPGASGNIVTEDLVFMIEAMGFRTGIDLQALIEARKILHAGLPAEPLHGHVAKAGIPRIFRAAA
ncbi:MAG TPA: hydroxymethylglutaryl-CoA lyase [Acidiphilium sp.]|nr:MAG: hydroxymethylglutaryl-CoA lyase [Acidiphilium sp. 21-60-14]OYV91951.1 MAG: hydroxymethylglutaryl-CoA lyase [Acidiphilium sp. 37-60-79]OZB39167.1 MAG: hydroxymethylglutaryl-CoA lyase [Acidiphilium sp. 34-60-192]HQT88374.1 hydroxymethylglutaryl-CoA lyase [Acidiphilium sp.]HQU23902.1 hydroxymethylglutaryl-CoA lyase [Acidiphilium sp.]